MLSASSHKHRPAQSVSGPNKKCWRHLASCPLRPVKYLLHCPQISIKCLSPLLMHCPAISVIPATWGQRQSKGRQLLTLRADFILITQVHDSPQGHWENMQPHNCEDSEPWPQHHIQVDDRTWNIKFSSVKNLKRKTWCCTLFSEITSWRAQQSKQFKALLRFYRFFCQNKWHAWQAASSLSFSSETQSSLQRWHVGMLGWKQHMKKN